MINKNHFIWSIIFSFLPCFNVICPESFNNFLILKSGDISGDLIYQVGCHKDEFVSEGQERVFTFAAETWLAKTRLSKRLVYQCFCNHSLFLFGSCYK